MTVTRSLIGDKAGMDFDLLGSIKVSRLVESFQTYGRGPWPFLAPCQASSATMSASIPGNRELPASQYDLNTYLGRVKQAAEISDPR